MHLLKLIFRNIFRHKLRTGLTVLGIIVAILAFGLLSTVVDAWYAGANASSDARLITRNAISLIFPLPINYREKIRQVDGVKTVSFGNWFGGVYKEPKNFFPKFAIDPATYFHLYPEFVISDAERTAFARDRRGAIVGRKLAERYGFKIGDSIPLIGDIYPGNWQFFVRGIYDGRDAKIDTSQMFFHWQYLNETVKTKFPRRADQTGIYFIEINDPSLAASVSRDIDKVFKNSLAETLTETEKAFQLGFIAQTKALVVAIRIVSYVVILIILAVMANTMAMTARERLSEYATLKVLGFGPVFLASLIFGESLMICAIGAALGIAFTFPVAAWFAGQVGTVFPVFEISRETLLLQIACAIVVGVIAALAPIHRATSVKIVDGLRSIG
ncbi:MAG: ABC transporter permease [Pseudomonadota bacterium]|nr:ABC transporter permease [Pseudomonadota bacterium]